MHDWEGQATRCQLNLRDAITRIAHREVARMCQTSATDTAKEDSRPSVPQHKARPSSATRHRSSPSLRRLFAEPGVGGVASACPFNDYAWYVDCLLCLGAIAWRPPFEHVDGEKLSDDYL